MIGLASGTFTRMSFDKCVSFLSRFDAICQIAHEPVVSRWHDSSIVFKATKGACHPFKVVEANEAAQLWNTSEQPANCEQVFRDG